MIRITGTKANAIVNEQFGNLADNGKLRIYSGTQPSIGGAAITTQVLLAEFTLPAAAFGGASGGIATAASIAGVEGLATGIPTWFRLLESNGTHMCDGSVGTADADLLIDVQAIAQGQVVSVVSLTIKMALGNA